MMMRKTIKRNLPDPAVPDKSESLRRLNFPLQPPEALELNTLAYLHGCLCIEDENSNIIDSSCLLIQN